MSAGVFWVMVASTILTLSFVRGWHKKDPTTGLPVVEKVTWVPSNFATLAGRWEKVLTTEDSQVRVFGRAADVETFLATIVCGALGLVFAFSAPNAAAGIAASLVAGALAFLFFRGATAGCYLSRPGVMVSGMLVRILPWSEVERFEIGPHGKAECVTVIATNGHRHKVRRLNRSRGFRENRLPVGPGRWRLFGFDDLVAQLEQIRRDAQCPTDLTDPAE